MLLALTSAGANSSVALREDQHQCPNWPEEPPELLFKAHLSLTNWDLTTLLKRSHLCSIGGGGGVTWITGWMRTPHSHLRPPPPPKHPSVSVAYGNHAVMNCCLLCSLQGAQLNIPQRICHTVVLHTETCSSFDIHKNVCIDKRVPWMLHDWPAWQVTTRLNNVTENIPRKNKRKAKVNRSFFVTLQNCL